MSAVEKKKGKECIIKSNDSKIINERYSLIMAISNEKIIDFNIVKKKKRNKSDTYKFINKLVSKDKENIFSYFMEMQKYL